MNDRESTVTQVEPVTTAEPTPVQEEVPTTIPFLGRSMAGRPMAVRTGIKAGEEIHKNPGI